jgi:cell division protein FtsN
MTVSEIPPARTPPAAGTATAAIPSEIIGEPAPSSPSVDPLPAGAALPPASDFSAPAAPDVAPPAIAAEPPAPTKPSAAELAAAKAEKDRLAREAAAAKKAEAARIAEEKRLKQLAAVQPQPEPPIEAPAVAASPPAAATGRDASGRPTLLTPPSFDLTPPGVTAPPPAAAPPVASTQSAIVADESPAAAAPPAAGGAFVVQIGAFNSAEDAADSWKRIQRAHASALGGASPEIRQTQINGSTKYRLRASGYADRGAASTACNRLKAAGQQCFVAAR